jgi:prophage antirepressor-like protein
MKPSIFNFNEHGVRVALDANGLPLFCLADVCNALGMQRANPSRFNLNPKGTHSLCTPTISGNQFITFISEENLYRIVFRSTKPEALNFQNWVFAEVLPTIRKTGSYSARQTAYEELNRLCMLEKVSKDKGTFHSLGMHRRKHEKHLNAVRIETCKANLQFTFEGVDHE